MKLEIGQVWKRLDSGSDYRIVELYWDDGFEFVKFENINKTAIFSTSVAFFVSKFTCIKNAAVSAGKGLL